MVKINNKRGELTTQQIITLIILIVSFAIILFFIFRLNLGGETTNKEICHNSVLLKAKAKVGGSALDCTTSYICISGGEKCENFNSEQEVVEIDLNPELKEGETKESNIKNQVMGKIADEMADCWWMFGEGKVDYVGLSANYNCGICSSVQFGNDVQQIPLDYKEFYEYLSKTKKDSSKTYLMYLYSKNSFAEVQDQVKTDTKIDINDKPFDLTKRYIVYTGSEYVVKSADNFLHPYIIMSDEVEEVGFVKGVFSNGCSNFDLTKA